MMSTTMDTANGTETNRVNNPSTKAAPHRKRTNAPAVAASAGNGTGRSPNLSANVERSMSGPKSLCAPLIKNTVPVATRRIVSPHPCRCVRLPLWCTGGSLRQAAAAAPFCAPDATRNLAFLALDSLWAHRTKQVRPSSTHSDGCACYYSKAVPCVLARRRPSHTWSRPPP
jgi:hypothetical protein